MNITMIKAIQSTVGTVAFKKIIDLTDRSVIVSTVSLFPTGSDPDTETF